MPEPRRDPTRRPCAARRRPEQGAALVEERQVRAQAPGVFQAFEPAPAPPGRQKSSINGADNGADNEVNRKLENPYELAATEVSRKGSIS
jgi:hypothetical protein